MTREEAKRTLEDLREYKIVLSDIPFNDQEKICDLAISALSTDGEYIKKEDALKRPYKLWNGSEYVSVVNEDYLNSLPTYSFPDSAENKGEWKMPAQDDGMSDPIYYQVRCSKCGFDLDPQTWHQELHQYGADNFCPNCGADMRPEPYKGE